MSSLRAADVDWTDADRDELLASADDALDRLTELVTNLLDLSRLQAGVLPVLSRAGRARRRRAARARLSGAAGRAARRRRAADLPEVIADAGLLERVIANLVQNALRYTPRGRAGAVTGSAHAGLVELRVIDRGPGIPAADAERCSPPFQRRDDSPHAGAGVGLGLAIARGFTEAMGGHVFAEETPGGGATLVVQLKAARDRGCRLGTRRARRAMTGP